MALLLLCHFHVPAVNLPPFGWPCERLRACAAERHSPWYVEQAVRHTDCTLQVTDGIGTPDPNPKHLVN